MLTHFEDQVQEAECNNEIYDGNPNEANVLGQETIAWDLFWLWGNYEDEREVEL
jgi:hypothetical protein